MCGPFAVETAPTGTEWAFRSVYRRQIRVEFSVGSTRKLLGLGFLLGRCAAAGLGFCWIGVQLRGWAFRGSGLGCEAVCGPFAVETAPTGTGWFSAVHHRQIRVEFSVGSTRKLLRLAVCEGTGLSLQVRPRNSRQG